MTQKILIVDDEAHLRYLVEQCLEDLEDEGVDLLQAKDGEEALECAKTEHPNLIFMDVMMPKLNGLDACRHIKKEWGMNCKVIILTAKGQILEECEKAEIGADHLMSKPFDPADLLNIAREALEMN